MSLQERKAILTLSHVSSQSLVVKERVLSKAYLKHEKILDKENITWTRFHEGERIKILMKKKAIEKIQKRNQVALMKKCQRKVKGEKNEDKEETEGETKKTSHTVNHEDASAEPVNTLIPLSESSPRHSLDSLSSSACITPVRDSLVSDVQEDELCPHQISCVSSQPFSHSEGVSSYLGLGGVSNRRRSSCVRLTCLEMNKESKTGEFGEAHTVFNNKAVLPKISETMTLDKLSKPYFFQNKGTKRRRSSMDPTGLPSVLTNIPEDDIVHCDNMDEDSNKIAYDYLMINNTEVSVSKTESKNNIIKCTNKTEQVNNPLKDLMKTENVNKTKSMSKTDGLESILEGRTTDNILYKYQHRNTDQRHASVDLGSNLTANRRNSRRESLPMLKTEPEIPPWLLTIQRRRSSWKPQQINHMDAMLRGCTKIPVLAEPPRKKRKKRKPGYLANTESNSRKISFA